MQKVGLQNGEVTKSTRNAVGFLGKTSLHKLSYRVAQNLADDSRFNSMNTKALCIFQPNTTEKVTHIYNIPKFSFHTKSASNFNAEHTLTRSPEI